MSFMIPLMGWQNQGKSMMLNWIDIVILVILLFYAGEGYGLGAFPAFFDLLQFTISFFLGLRFYSVISPFLTMHTAIPHGISNAISFFLIAFIGETLLQIFFRNLLKKVNEESFMQKPELKKVNKLLGVFPGILSGLVLVMFVITVVASLPVSPFLKQSLTDSKIGDVLLARSQLFEKQVGSVFGPAASDTLNFLTIEPESSSTVSLHFTYKDGQPNPAVEEQMIQMVNDERAKNGLSPVREDSLLRQVARAHAVDMLTRGYFSHFTPEGLSPFDRMNNAGVQYQSAGENLAFSPNLTLAMQGLMQSPGHRANILSKDFGKVGIGVIDAGIFGEMFVQEFTN